MSDWKASRRNFREERRDRDQSPAASKSLTPRTRQIRGSLCSSKLDFDIDDLCTLTLRRRKEREREREREKRRRACAGNFSSRRFDRPSETNFRFSSSIILRLPRWHLTPRFTLFFVLCQRSLVFPVVVRLLTSFARSFIRVCNDVSSVVYFIRLSEDRRTYRAMKLCNPKSRLHDFNLPLPALW